MLYVNVDNVALFLEEKGEVDFLKVWNDYVQDIKKGLQIQKTMQNGEKFEVKFEVKLCNNKPKCPLSAYVLFGNEIRDQIKKDRPSFDGRKIMKEQGRRWAKLKKENKEEVDRLNLLAKEDRNRYSKEMEKYTYNLQKKDKIGYSYHFST